MRLIGSLTEKQEAEKFSAFLLTEGISSHLEEENGEFEIWIKDEDWLERSIKELDLFRPNSDDPKYSAAIQKAKELQLEQIKKRQRIAKNIVNVSGGQTKRSFPLTIWIVGICAVVAVMTNFGDLQSTTKAPFRALAFNAISDVSGRQILDANNGDPDTLAFRLASIKQGELWRLVTPIFIHFGALHIIFNMYWLVIFGSQIENRYGPYWFGLLILFAAIFSNFFQCIVPIEIGGSRPQFIGSYTLNLFGGMSGVNYALFGFVLMRMTYDRSSNLFVAQGTVFFLLAWLVFCMTPMASQWLGITAANWAHAIGLLVGLIAGYWPMIIGSGTARSR